LRKLSERPPRRALPAIVAVVAVVASVIGFAGVARADTTYELHVRHSGKCMDVAHRSLADKSAVIQYSCNQQSNQEWRFVPVAVSGGVQYYQLRVSHSDKCLDVWNASRDDHADAIQYTCDLGKTHQQFQVMLAGGYSVLVARHSRKCLRVEGGSQADLAQVEQFACNPEAHDQQWQLVND